MWQVNELCFVQGRGLLDKSPPLSGPQFPHQSTGDCAGWPRKPLLCQGVQLRAVNLSCPQDAGGCVRPRYLEVVSVPGPASGVVWLCVRAFGGTSACLWDPWVSAGLHVLHSSALCECV